MRRDPALMDLSRDHHHALVQARALQQCAAGAAGAGEPEAVADDFLRFWAEDASLHFREEEEVLLPILGRLGPPSADPAVRQMLDDHAWLRDAVHALAADRAAGRPVRERLGAIGARLAAHVEVEERGVFEETQARLSASDLADLAERSRAHRLAARGPSAVGPRKPGRASG